tara:strand:+ start:1636 stop:1749 length:114 start_codon:yes stop_codon:yes gene_type:complete
MKLNKKQKRYLSEFFYFTASLTILTAIFHYVLMGWVI